MVLSHPDASLPRRWQEAALGSATLLDKSPPYNLLRLATGIPVLARLDPSQMPLAEGTVLQAHAPRFYPAQDLAGWLNWVETSNRMSAPRRRKQVLAFQTAALWGRVVGSQPVSPGTAFPVPAALLSQCLADDPLRVIPGDPVSLAALQLAKRAGW